MVTFFLVYLLTINPEIVYQLSGIYDTKAKCEFEKTEVKLTKGSNRNKLVCMQIMQPHSKDSESDKSEDIKRSNLLDKIF